MPTKKASATPTLTLSLKERGGSAEDKSLDAARDKTVEQLREEVEMILKEIRPYVNSHGGDVKLVEVTPTSVKLRIEGTCVGCSLSEYTYGVIVEEAIREYIPQITEITYS